MIQQKIYKVILLIMVSAAIPIIGFSREIPEKYLVQAAENNPELKAKFNEYMAALEKVPQVGVLPDPQIAFGYFIQPVETRVGPQQARFSVSQMFPWFGTLEAEKNIAGENAKVKFETFKEAKANLFFDIKSTWYDLYFNKRAIEITKENIDILNTFRKLALVKIEAGMASAVDEIRVEMNILDLENQLKQLQDKFIVREVTFFNLLNVAEQGDLELPDSLPVTELRMDKTVILDSIKLKNHQLLQLDFRKASYEYQQKLAKSKGRPDFSIGLDYIMIEESSNDMLSTGESGQDAVMAKIGVAIPLYRKKYKSMIKEAVIMQEAILQKKANKQNVLETVYEKAHAEYKDALRQVSLHKKQVKLAEKALRILESEYATNGKNFEEILRMEKQILKHSLMLEKSRADFNTSVAFINYLMGKE